MPVPLPSSREKLASEVISTVCCAPEGKDTQRSLPFGATTWMQAQEADWRNGGQTDKGSIAAPHYASFAYRTDPEYSTTTGRMAEIE